MFSCMCTNFLASVDSIFKLEIRAQSREREGKKVALLWQKKNYKMKFFEDFQKREWEKMKKEKEGERGRENERE